MFHLLYFMNTNLQQQKMSNLQSGKKVELDIL